MEKSGYCRLCGKIKTYFCCQACYEADATKSTTKRKLRGEVEAQAAIIDELTEALEGLFENCAMIHKSWGDGDNSKQADAAIQAALAAIAKAKGD